MAQLRAGSAKLEITPDRNIGLLGYAFRFEAYPPGNDGVLDPLHVRVVALDDGSGQAAAIVNLDLATLERPVARRIRQRVAERLSTDMQHVIVCCTHTHSGPFPLLQEDEDADAGALDEDAVQHADRKAEHAYCDFLLPIVEKAAVMAAGKMYPVSVAAQESPFGIGYDRRVINSEGDLEHCWHPQEQDHLHPQTPADVTCTVLHLRQTNGPRSFVLWSVGAHNLVLGKTSNRVSADFAGMANHLLEDLLPGAFPAFCFGACGDVHPWIATQAEPEYIRPIATACAGFVASLAHAVKPLPHDQLLRTAEKTVTFGKVELDLVAWNLCGLRIACAPVEMFTGLSAMLREKLGRPLFLVTEANGRSGYWPTAAAFDQGGYEVDIAQGYGLEKGDGERLVDELAALVGQL